MFAYCGNNPVNMSDPTGEFWIVAILAIVTCAVVLSGCDTKSPPKDYVSDDSKDQNCYSYAFGLEKATNPGIPSVTSNDSDYLYKDKAKYSTQEITEFVERDMKKLNKSVRVVQSPTEKSQNEYIVAMKTSDKILKGVGIADYHFAVQLSDGTWADKPGGLKSRWNALDGTAVAWDYYNQIEGYYNSETVYFAVGK